MKEIEVKEVWRENYKDEIFDKSFRLCVRTTDDIIYKFHGICDDQLDLLVRQYYNEYQNDKVLRTTNVMFTNIGSITKEVMNKYDTSLFIFDRFLYPKVQNESKYVKTPAAVVQKINLDSQTITISILTNTEGKLLSDLLGEDRVRFKYNENSELFEYEVVK